MRHSLIVSKTRDNDDDDDTDFSTLIYGVCFNNSCGVYN